MFKFYLIGINKANYSLLKAKIVFLATLHLLENGQADLALKQLQELVSATVKKSYWKQKKIKESIKTVGKGIG